MYAQQYSAGNIGPTQISAPAATGPTAMQSFAVGASALSTLFGALGAIEQGKMQRSMARINAQFAEIQAADAIARGAETEGNFRGQIRQLIGKQKSTYAAANVDLSAGGSVEDVIGETARIGEQDAMQIRLNALRESFGYKMQSVNATAQGRMSKAQSLTEAGGTLLAGGAQIFSMASKFGFGG